MNLPICVTWPVSCFEIFICKFYKCLLVTFNVAVFHPNIPVCNVPPLAKIRNQWCCQAIFSWSSNSLLNLHSIIYPATRLSMAGWSALRSKVDHTYSTCCSRMSWRSPSRSWSGSPDSKMHISREGIDLQVLCETKMSQMTEIV